MKAVSGFARVLGLGYQKMHRLALLSRSTKSGLAGVRNFCIIMQDNQENQEKHHELLKKVYAAAPIGGLINDHVISFDSKGDTTVSGFIAQKKHCHTMGSLHGSCYFKLLDDAAFFAAQARSHELFVLTLNFNMTMMRPVLVGETLRCDGRVTSASKSVIVAEASLYLTKARGAAASEEDVLVASGTGTFVRHPKLGIDAVLSRMPGIL